MERGSALRFPFSVSVKALKSDHAVQGLNSTWLSVKKYIWSAAKIGRTNSTRSIKKACAG